MSKHYLKTMIALICFALIGVLGVWVTHYVEKDTSPKNNPTGKESVTSVVNAVIERISK